MVSLSLVRSCGWRSVFSVADRADAGYSDLPSRLPTQSSTLYSNNVTKFFLSMTEKDNFVVNLEDEVVRGSIILHKGEVLPPAPMAAPPPAAPSSTATKAVEEEATKALTPWQKASREVATVTAGMGSIVALGKFTGPALMSNFFTFGLASLIGYRVVWGVTPAVSLAVWSTFMGDGSDKLRFQLHSPLMSVTNAISGMVGVGGLFIMGGGYLPGTIPQALGALSVLLASVNVAGGFVITKRMLDMFKRGFYIRFLFHRNYLRANL